MIDGNKIITQEFVSNCCNEIRKEEKQLSKKKQYQMMLKDTITHIANVIYNQATQEQLKEYKDIDIRIHEVMNTIENVIQDIAQVEEKLGDIEKLLSNVQNDADDKNTCLKILFLQNELNTKKDEIEETIKQNKTGSIVEELSDISNKIAMNRNKIYSVQTATNNENDFLSVYTHEKDITLPEKIEPCIPVELKKEDIVERQDLNIGTNEETRFDLNNNVYNKDEDTNILIVSQRTKTVHLPYKREDIDYYKSLGYDSEEEIVKRFFIVPLKYYINFSKSRVRERL